MAKVVPGGRRGRAEAIGWLLVAICALLALASLSHRWRVEAENRAVGLAVEVAGVRDAPAIGLSQALERLKAHGLNMAVLQEETVGDLVARGDLRFEPGGALIGPAQVLARAAPFLEAQFGLILPPGTEAVRLPGASAAALRALSVGLNPEEARAAREAGLTIVARHANRPGMNAASIRALLGSSREMGATVFLPLGDQALGSRDLLCVTESEVRALGYLYATPEFARIAGNARLAAALEDRLVRLHSIMGGEVDRMAPTAVVDRFARAFRERNQRILLVRPMSAAQAAPLASLATTLDAVRAGVEREGGVVRSPRPFAEPGVPLAVAMALALAVGAMVVWAGFGLFFNPVVRLMGVALVLAALAGAPEPTTRVYIALLGAIAFPVAAYQLWRMRPAMAPWLAMGAITAVSVTGGLTVAGLLNALPFLVKTDQFFGVKLAHFLPILVIAWLLAADQGDLRALLGQTVRWGAALLALGLAVALGLMFVRTGHDNPDAVTGLELRLRGLLDAWLYARPRTKEFLLGHPALWCGLMLVARARRGGSSAESGWAALLLATGAIGQTSIVNTLCHLHTPLSQGLGRIATGLALGLAVGMIAWWALRVWLDRRRTHDGGGEGIVTDA